jgi:hypothetical protein
MERKHRGKVAIRHFWDGHVYLYDVAKIGVVQIPVINDTLLVQELEKVGGLYAGLSPDMIKLDQAGQNYVYPPKPPMRMSFT